MDRRGFLRAFGVGVPAGAVLIHNIPEAEAHEMPPGEKIPLSLPKPIDAYEAYEAKIEIIARAAAADIQERARLPLGRIVNIEDSYAQHGDTVNYPTPRSDGGLGNIQLRLRHVEASFQVPDFDLACSDQMYLRMFMTSACIALAEELTNYSRGKRVLAYRKLPHPIRGIGVLAAYANTADVSLRTILGWSPVSLGQVLTIDTLFGVA
jgi:hypothetical protein